MNEEQLKRLNRRRKKIIEQETFLISKRMHVMSQLGLIDEKLETIDSLKAVVDIQLNEEIRNGNLSIIVHQVVNKKAQIEPMAEIRFLGHPPIFKLFDEIEYFLYKPSKERNTDNVVYINHIKHLALEWLKNQESYMRFFDDISVRNNRIDDDFINDVQIDESINRPYLL